MLRWAYQLQKLQHLHFLRLFSAFISMHQKIIFFTRTSRHFSQVLGVWIFLNSRGFNPKSKLEELEKKNLYRFQSNYLFESSSMESINYLFFGVTSDIIEFLNRCIQISEALLSFWINLRLN